MFMMSCKALVCSVSALSHGGMPSAPECAFSGEVIILPSFLGFREILSGEDDGALFTRFVLFKTRSMHRLG